MERKRYRSWMALAKSTQLDDSGQEKIRFRSQGVKGSSLFHAKDILERANGTFNGRSFSIPGIPLRRVTQDAGIEPFVSVGVNVNAAPVFRGVQGVSQEQRRETPEAVLTETAFGQTNFKRLDLFFPPQTL